MRRDVNVIRSILLDLETGKENTAGTPAEAWTYHVELMNEAGLIRARDVTTLSGIPRWRPLGLNPAGREFLDLARDEGRWKRVTDTMLEKLGVVPFEILKELLERDIQESMAVS